MLKQIKFFFLLLLLTPSIIMGVLSEFTHFDHQNMIDARAGGMGGAYIALSDTLVGSYYNPAGLAYIDHKRTTESNNIFRTTSLSYTGASDNFSYEFKSETTAPPFIGLFQNYGDYNVVFSIIIPKSETYNKDYTKSFTNDEGSNITYYENFDGHNNHYLIGPSVATLLTDDISIGMSLFYSYESRNYIQNIYTFPTDFANTMQIWNNTYNEESTQELLGIFGIQWMPRMDVSVGAKLNLPLQLSSTGTEQQTEASIDHHNNNYSSTIATSSYNLGEMGFQSNYPNLGIGCAYILSAQTLFVIDTNYMFAGKTSTDFPTKSTLNIALGMEHYVLPIIPIRMGFYTNNSYYPENSNGDHLNGIGFTASIGYESGANSLSFGIDYQTGSGESTNNGNVTDHLDYSGITLLISGSSNI